MTPVTLHQPHSVVTQTDLSFPWWHWWGCYQASAVLTHIQPNTLQWVLTSDNCFIEPISRFICSIKHSRLMYCSALCVVVINMRSEASEVIRKGQCCVIRIWLCCRFSPPWQSDHNMREESDAAEQVDDLICVMDKVVGSQMDTVLVLLAGWLLFGAVIFLVSHLIYSTLNTSSDTTDSSSSAIPSLSVSPPSEIPPVTGSDPAAVQFTQVWDEQFIHSLSSWILGCVTISCVQSNSQRWFTKLLERNIITLCKDTQQWGKIFRININLLLRN